MDDASTGSEQAQTGNSRVATVPPHGSRTARALVVGFLLLLLVAELALSVRRQTQTWDEACHIFAGYMSWKRADFGINPEHPPLLKMVATLPLLNLPLKTPVPQDRNFKVGAFLDGHDFVYWNDADRILFRTRMAAAIFMVALALLVFAAASELCGSAPAFLALVLFVLEPSLLAHGALVTTDIGLTCCLFATVYSFYRYVKRPSLWRMVVVGIAAGLALSVKHSGLLLFPILVLLALVDLLWTIKTEPVVTGQRVWVGKAFRLAGSLVAIGLMASALLWSSYGFRYTARPGKQAMNPSLNEYAQGLNSAVDRRIILTLAGWRLLPESYLYGLTDVRLVADNTASYLFGKVYPSGQWFYFPAAFVIKSSLALLLLLLAGIVLLVWKPALRWKELLFLILPPAIYFVVAVTSGLNLGVRHILPIYPFLVILAGWAGYKLITLDSRWVCAITALLIFDFVSSARSFPVYLAYSNEAWGGPANTYRLLTDSNADWGQQLYSVRDYLEKRGVHECWFAYFADVVADSAYYGIPCKPLTTIASVWLQPWRDVPAAVDGPVLVSAGVLSGYEFGPRELNPYDQFQRLTPTAVIEHGVFVFDGHFEIPLAAALNHVTRASLYQRENKLQEAEAEARTAVKLAPDSVWTQQKLGSVLTDLKRPQEARAAFEKALTIARTIQPERQKGWVPGLEAALAKGGQ